MMGEGTHFRADRAPLSLRDGEDYFADLLV
jgi:hypothetical protein